jgi:hypothetical protein
VLFCRKDIIGRHEKEKLKAIEYMSMLQSRVAVTIDMWTADNQKKGYMAVTGHFIDESWKLRSILMGYVLISTLCESFSLHGSIVLIGYACLLQVYICAGTAYRRCYSRRAP